MSKEAEKVYAMLDAVMDYMAPRKPVHHWVTPRQYAIVIEDRKKSKGRSPADDPQFETYRGIQVVIRGF